MLSPAIPPILSTCPDTGQNARNQSEEEQITEDRLRARLCVWFLGREHSKMNREGARPLIKYAVS